MQKVKPYRSKKYMAFIAKQPCLKCKTAQDVQPHHYQSKGQGTMGGKVGDDQCVPLCFKHHREIHDMGRTTWFSWNINPEYHIERLKKEFELDKS